MPCHYSGPGVVFPSLHFELGTTLLTAYVSLSLVSIVRSHVFFSSYTHLSFVVPPPPPLQPREKGRMRFHRLQNVQIALDFLKQRQVKLVNIRNDDITDGNPKLTLGLIWTIILHFQVCAALCVLVLCCSLPSCSGTLFCVVFLGCVHGTLATSW
uniref:Calponin-homology (CH) domain-containing protein n=1 Tax=Salmo trutta TaxID=8032 RepID=A0A674ABL6_SALTR